MTQLVAQSVINQFFDGTHSDPFSVLGMHETDNGIEIRALLPDASRVSVIDKENQDTVCELDCLDDRGFFAGVVPNTRDFFAYQLQVYWGKESQILEDPYRYHPMINDLDEWLLAEGSFLRPYEVLGAHFIECDGVSGVNFRLWAPNAKRVSVVGDFNYWDGRRHPMRLHPASGVWELFLPKVALGQLYKFELIDCHGNLRLKADPYAFSSQLRPDTASQISALPDIVPMTEARRKANLWDQPISIYEVHLGSWRRNLENNFWLDYDQIGDELIPYVKEMGFTHIEFLPLSEFPFDGSWGYQPLGLYSPTSRFGTPEGFKRLVERAHEAGINVILDWVPGHFPSDTHGLVAFDGTALYEHADPREGFHQDWNTLIYNYGRNEVKNFLSSNALYWIERFGIDGIRVDAVASMLYLDYSRAEGQWVPNKYGGRENLEAIDFLRYVNRHMYERHPGTMMIAEESTSFPGVTKPVDKDGLGFGFKWNMGWMNDTLRYLALDPVYRQYEHNLLTFAMVYQYSENFILPISHDEVVHGKGSMINKVPQDDWRKFATLRAFYSFMWSFPGKQLIFMGSEFAQRPEFNEATSLEWWVTELWGHGGLQRLFRDLNMIYRDNPPLFELDNAPEGFTWINADDKGHNTLSWVRNDSQGNHVACFTNFSPEPLRDYLVGLPGDGEWEEILNTDSETYDGSGQFGNLGVVTAHDEPWGHFPASAEVTIPPLGSIWLRSKTR